MQGARPWPRSGSRNLRGLVSSPRLNHQAVHTVVVCAQPRPPSASPLSATQRASAELAGERGVVRGRRRALVEEPDACLEHSTWRGRAGAPNLGVTR